MLSSLRLHQYNIHSITTSVTPIDHEHADDLCLFLPDNFQTIGSGLLLNTIFLRTTPTISILGGGAGALEGLTGEELAIGGELLRVGRASLIRFEARSSSTVLRVVLRMAYGSVRVTNLPSSR